MSWLYKRTTLRNRKRSSPLPLNDRILRTALGARTAQCRVRASGRYYPRRYTVLVLINGVLTPQIRHSSIRITGSRYTLRFDRGSGIVVTGLASYDPVASGNRYFNALESAVLGPATDTTLSVTGGINKGSQTCVLSGGAPDVGSWYFLHDVGRKEQDADSVNFREVGGELVKVTGWNGANNTATLGAQVTQAYANAATVFLSKLPAGATVSEEVTLEGGQIIGSLEQGFGAFIALNYVSSCLIKNVFGKGSGTTGISLGFSRSSTVDHCRFLSLPKRNNNDPWGYSIQIDRTVTSVVRNSTADSAQYVLTIEGGSASISAVNISAYRCDSSFDIHGGDAIDITVDRCVGPVKLTLGNTTWRRGASFVTINDSIFTQLRITGPIRDLTLNRCYGEQAKFEYTKADPYSLTLSNPVRTTFSACRFTLPVGNAENYVISLPAAAVPTPNYKVEDMKIIGCELVNEKLDPVTGKRPPIYVLTINTLQSSKVIFENCPIVKAFPDTSTSLIAILNDAQLPVPVSLVVDVKGSTFVLTSGKTVASGTAATLTTELLNRLVGGTPSNRRCESLSGPFTNLSGADVFNLKFTTV